MMIMIVMMIIIMIMIDGTIFGKFRPAERDPSREQKPLPNQGYADAPTEKRLPRTDAKAAANHDERQFYIRETVTTTIA